MTVEEIKSKVQAVRSDLQKTQPPKSLKALGYAAVELAEAAQAAPDRGLALIGAELMREALSAVMRAERELARAHQEPRAPRAMKPMVNWFGRRTIVL